MSLQNLGKISRFFNGEIDAVDGMPIDEFVKGAKLLGIGKESIEDLMFDLDFDTKDAKTITTLLDAVGDAGETTYGLGKLQDGLTGLWETVKNGGKSILGFITNPLTLGTIAAAAVVAGGAYLEWANSIERFAEKASEAKSILAETTSEIAAMEDTFASNEKTLKDLESSDTQTSDTKDRIAALKRENALLQAQIEYKKDIQKEQQEDSANAARDALTKQTYFQSGFAYTDAFGNRTQFYNDGEWTHTGGEYGDIITQTERYQDVLSNLEQQYDDLQDASSDSYIADAENRAKALENLDTEMDFWKDKILQNKINISEWYGSLFSNGELIDEGTSELANRIEQAFPELLDQNALSSEMQAIANQYAAFVGDAQWGLTEEQTTDFNNKFTNWLKSLSDEEQGILAQIAKDFDTSGWNITDWQNKLAELSDQVESEGDFSLTISTEQEGLETVTSALSEAQSATGLTEESMTALSKRYEELSGFDAGKLFENTATGIRLNTNYLKQLEGQYEAIKKQEIADEFTRLAQELSDVNSKIEEHGNGPLKDEFQAKKEDIIEEIEALEQLESQYSGLTSAYNEWVNAMNSNQPGSMFDSIVDAQDEMKKAFQDKQYGNTRLQEYLEMMTGADFSNAKDAVELSEMMNSSYSQLSQKIGSTSYSLNDFLKSGKTGCTNFLKAVEQLGEGWATFDRETGAWELNFDKEQLAQELGTSIDFIEAMLDKLKLYGLMVDTTPAQSRLDQLIEKVRQTKAELDVLDAYSVNIDINIDDPSDKIEEIKQKVDKLNKDTSISESEREATLKHLATAAEAAYAMMDEPFLSGLESDGLTASEQLAKNLIEARNAAQAASDVYGEGSEQFASANESFEVAKEAFEGIGGDVQALLDRESPEIKVATSTEEAPIAEPTDTESTHTVTFDYDDSAVQSYVPPDKEASVYYRAVLSGGSPSGGFNGGVFGSIFVNGTANASGTAYAKGNWGTASGEEALVGELGREIVVDPRTGKWYTVGDNGAEFADIPKGAIVFNHKQTESLLENGYVTSRGRALAGGTAFADPQFSGGVVLGNNGNTGNNSNNNSSGASKSEYDPDSDFFDWIEILVDRIERTIDRIAKVAESAYKNFSTRSSAMFDEIDKVQEEIGIQEQAYDYYLSYAEGIGLDQKYVERIQNGTMKISMDYSDELKAQIEDYQEFYEKALDAQEAVEELHENVAELYVDYFNSIQDDFEKQLDMLEHSTSMFETQIDIAEANGRLASTDYYKRMQDIERESISTMNQERDALQKAFDEAMNSGEIEVGSESWYEMKSAINEVDEAIGEANLSIAESAQKIREIEWEHFDYLIDTIAKLTSEADFLIDLMENSDLYTDNGQFSNTGTATMGLHAMSYNTYMAQADEYAKEILNIEKQLAEDPYNTELIERKEELLEAQRDSILAAEDEKQAIVDLVQEGIDLELDALQELIDKYTEALDSAKDLYDYQSKIADHTSEISSLRKQIYAYERDGSEETKATVQKLRTELESAEKELEETEYDQYISDQKKLLDELYTEYETILNEKMDNTDALLEEMIGCANANASDICDTIATEAANVGYVLSDNIQSIWGDASAENVSIAVYDSGFSEKLTTTNTILNDIEKYVSSMVDKSNNDASNTIGNETVFEAPETVDTYTPIDVRVEYPEEKIEDTSQTVITASSSSDDKQKNASKKPNNTSGNTSTKNADTFESSVGEPFKFDGLVEPIYKPIEPVLKAPQNTTNVDTVDTVVEQGIKEAQKNVDIAGNQGIFELGQKIGDWFSGLFGFSSGGLVDFTGIAKVHGTESKPELVLNADDTANFIELKDTLRVLSSQGLSFGQTCGYSIDRVSHVGNLDNISEILSAIRSSSHYDTSNTYGDINVDVSIDHVQDYNDFVNQLRDDSKFDKMIKSIALDEIAGKSSLSKNKYTW